MHLAGFGKELTFEMNKSKFWVVYDKSCRFYNGSQAPQAHNAIYIIII